MAEPVYPSLETEQQEERKQIGFEGLEKSAPSDKEEIQLLTSEEQAKTKQKASVYANESNRAQYA